MFNLKILKPRHLYQNPFINYSTCVIVLTTSTLYLRQAFYISTVDAQNRKVLEQRKSDREYAESKEHKMYRCSPQCLGYVHTDVDCISL